MFQAIPMERPLLDDVYFQPSVHEDHDNSRQSPGMTSESVDPSRIIEGQFSTSPSQGLTERGDGISDGQNGTNPHTSSRCEVSRRDNPVTDVVDSHNRANAHQEVHTRHPLNQHAPQDRGDGHQRQVVLNHNQNLNRVVPNRRGEVDITTTIGRNLRTVGDAYDREKRALRNQVQQQEQAAANAHLLDIHPFHPVHELVWDQILAAADLLRRIYFLLPR